MMCAAARNQRACNALLLRCSRVPEARSSGSGNGRNGQIFRARQTENVTAEPNSTAPDLDSTRFTIRPFRARYGNAVDLSPNGP